MDTISASRLPLGWAMSTDWSMVLALAMLAGCSAASLDPCARCLLDGPQTCVVRVACDADGGDADFGCTREHVGCFDPCAEGRACPVGHACTLLYGQQVCSEDCDPGLCPDGQECSPGGACHAVPCGSKVRCADATAFCDAYNNICYPANGVCCVAGACGADQCPMFDRQQARVAELSCDGTCRLSVPPPRVLDPTVPTVDVVVPSVGQVFAEPSVHFSWVPSDLATIVLLLNRRPSLSDDVLTHSIWGAALPRHHVSGVDWSGGVGIVNGVWQSTVPTLPADTPLFLLVQEVDEGRLRGASAPIPFGFGAPWRAPGDPCGEEGAIPGGCDSDLVPMGCFGGTCSVLCASRADCAAAFNGGIVDCSLPSTGFVSARICR